MDCQTVAQCQNPTPIGSCFEIQIMFNVSVAAKDLKSYCPNFSSMYGKFPQKKHRRVVIIKCRYNLRRLTWYCNYILLCCLESVANSANNFLERKIGIHLIVLCDADADADASVPSENREDIGNTLYRDVPKFVFCSAHCVVRCRFSHLRP